MVKIEVLKKRLEQLNLSLSKVKRYQKISLEEFIEEYPSNTAHLGTEPWS